MSSMDDLVEAELASLGWRWGDAGIVLALQTVEGPINVFVPLQSVWARFARFFPALGGVGCPHTAVGFWGAIKRAARSVSRRVKRVARKVVPKRIQRAAERVYKHAQTALSAARTAFQSDAATYALMGLAVVPGMAPASAGLLAAQQALKRVERGVAIAKRIVDGARATPAMVRALKRGRVAEKLIRNVRAGAIHGKPHAKHFLQGLQRIAAS